MALAIRAITRLQDADDTNLTLDATTHAYAIVWNNNTNEFVLADIGLSLGEPGEWHFDDAANSGQILTIGL